MNIGSGYDLVAAAADAPLYVPPSPSSSLPRGNYNNDGNSLEAAAAARKEATLNQMTGAEFLASINLSPSFSPPPRSLPINNPSNDTIAGASLCSNDAAYTAGPTSSATICEFINCYGTNGPCFICSGTFVGDPSGAGSLIFLTGKKDLVFFGPAARVFAFVVSFFVDARR